MAKIKLRKSTYRLTLDFGQGGSKNTEIFEACEMWIQAKKLNYQINRQKMKATTNNSLEMIA